MAAITSHHDETRKGVGVTAHMCAYIRGLESAKSPADRLIYDPYASALAGEVAAEYIQFTNWVEKSRLNRTILRILVNWSFYYWRVVPNYRR